MTIEVVQNIKNIEITVTQNNNEVTLQPILNTVSNSLNDGVDGGTP